MINLVKGKDNCITFVLNHTNAFSSLSAKISIGGQIYTLQYNGSQDTNTFTIDQSVVNGMTEGLNALMTEVTDQNGNLVCKAAVMADVLPLGSDGYGYDVAFITVVKIKETKREGTFERYDNYDDFPEKGKTWVVYIAVDTGKMYIWDDKADPPAYKVVGGGSTITPPAKFEDPENTSIKENSEKINEIIESLNGENV